MWVLIAVCAFLCSSFMFSRLHSVTGVDTRRSTTEGTPRAAQTLAHTCDDTLWIGRLPKPYKCDGQASRACLSHSGRRQLVSSGIESLCVARDGTTCDEMGYLSVARAIGVAVLLDARADDGELRVVTNVSQIPSEGTWALPNRRRNINGERGIAWHEHAIPLAEDASPTSSRLIAVPGYTQTSGFLKLWGLALFIGLSTALCIRVQGARADSIRAVERAYERVRIARELHDTVLQGVQGLMLTFHAAAQKLPPDAESRSALDNALATAEAIMIEGRNVLNNLRVGQLNDAEVAQSLQKLGADLNVDGCVVYSVERRGSLTTLAPHVASEISYVTREAVTNAFRHSRASKITVRLAYETKCFIVSCQDNGCGLPDQPITEATRRGHWGMRGMEERVARLGGRMCVRSTSGKGTEVVVTLPRSRAYHRLSRFAQFKDRLQLHLAWS